MIYYPLSPTPEEAPVVVFMHGYGGLNPMYYGGWIEHLVRTGRTVVFPYYQDNLFAPSPDEFHLYAATAIRDALDLLKTTDSLPRPKGNRIDFIGHSFGGAISARLASEPELHDLPPTGNLLLAMAGTGLIRKGRLDDYSGIPADVRLTVVVAANDKVVGNRFSATVYETATQVRRKLWINLTEKPGSPALKASHNEVCSRNNLLDNGERQLNYSRTIRNKMNLDAHDSLAFWRTFDWMQSQPEEPVSTWIQAEDLLHLADLGKDKAGNKYGLLELEAFWWPVDAPPVRKQPSTLPTHPVGLRPTPNNSR